jgi:predicted RND superfamily exporter protein
MMVSAFCILAVVTGHTSKLLGLFTVLENTRPESARVMNGMKSFVTAVDDTYSALVVSFRAQPGAQQPTLKEAETFSKNEKKEVSGQNIINLITQIG